MGKVVIVASRVSRPDEVAFGMVAPMDKKRAATKRPQEIELYSDAWERFERAVDAGVKSGPKHKRAPGKQPNIVCRTIQEAVDAASTDAGRRTRVIYVSC